MEDYADVHNVTSSSLNKLSKNGPRDDDDDDETEPDFAGARRIPPTSSLGLPTLDRGHARLEVVDLMDTISMRGNEGLLSVDDRLLYENWLYRNRDSS